MDESSFSALLSRHKALEKAILENTRCEDGMCVTAYTKIDIPRDDTTLMEDLVRHEIYRTDALEVFMDAHVSRMKRFARNHDPDVMYVFECVFLQNHINEIILKHDLDFDRMVTYFNTLLSAFSPLRPIIVHINMADVEAGIRHVTEERRTDDPSRYKDWIDLVKAYVAGTKHGASKGYATDDGHLRYFKDRQDIELKLLDFLDCDVIRIDLHDDHDTAYGDLVVALGEMGIGIRTQET